MKRIVVDIETDSLDATTIHCVVIKEGSKIHTYTPDNLSDCVGHIEAADIIVMHNGVSFDAPVLKRLLNVDIPLNKIRDTLILSQMVNPMRDGGHSLEAWGKSLG